MGAPADVEIDHSEIPKEIQVLIDKRFQGLAENPMVSCLKKLAQVHLGKTSALIGNQK